MPTRRQVLRAAGATATAGVAVGTLPSRARAEHLDQQPAHVTLTFDQDRLDRYRPYLKMEPQDREKFLDLYGWLATSTEFATDCCVYWAEYSHQEGVTSFDSHFGDHEPVYVFVDGDTDRVVEVVASIYHWTAGRGVPALEDDHPLLKVISPWHHYTAADEAGTLFAVEDLDGEYSQWLDNGLEDDIEPGLVVNPWRMQSRGHWWRDDVGGVSLTATEVWLYRRLGFGVEGEL